MRFDLLRGSVALLLVAAAYGQTSVSQEISGIVQDTNGEIIPNVTVKVKNSSIGLTRSSVSNDSGLYLIPHLPIGEYEVSTQAPGFKTFVLTNVVVTVNSKVPVNIRLEIGNSAESINAKADAVHVETTSGQVSRLVTSEQVIQIPLSGRNFPQLLQLLPGVSTTYSSGFDLFTSSGVNTSAQSINGSRTDAVGWYIDGADNKENGASSTNFVNINPDAIAELNVLSSSYSAEYGYSAGPIVNVAIRSGTKDFHGGAYDYLRRDSFDARAFNATSKPELHYDNFGFNIGGPVYLPGEFNKNRDKLFFFFSNDYKRLKEGTVNTWTVPVTAQRNGDFSSLPYYRWPTDPLTGQSFPNGIIPKTRFSANSARLLQNYPTPNFTGPGGNYTFTTVTPLDADQYVVKGDYNLSARSQVSVHYLRDYYTSTQGQTQLIQYNRNVPGTNASAQWTFVKSPTTVHVAAFSFTGNKITQKTGIKANPLFINDYTRSGEGITYPMFYSASNAIPSVNVSGYTSLTATPLNSNSFDQNLNARYDVSQIRDTHNLKAGVLVMRTMRDLDTVPALNGAFNFTTAASNTSGNALADAVLGNFYTYSEAGNSRQAWLRLLQAETYVQDDWKYSERITVNAGLRWYYMPPWYSALNNTVSFFPENYNSNYAPRMDTATGAITIPNTSFPYNGLVLAGTSFPSAATGRVPNITDKDVKNLFQKPGLPKGAAKTYWLNFAPRIGIAYDLTGSQTTIIRAGAGVYYERIPGNYLAGAVNNVPFVQQSQVYNANVDNPGGASALTFPGSIVNSHYLSMKNPRTINISLGVEHKLSKDTIIEAGYVGSQATDLTYQQNLNQLRPGTVQANRGINVNAMRPYLGYADIYEFANGGGFIYHSGQIQLRKQLSRGGIVNLAYTYSSGRTDTNSYDYQPMNSYNLRGDWGKSSYNRRNIVALSYVYPLPFWRDGSDWYKKVLGGWQVSGLTLFQNGLPVNLTVQGDPAGIGISGNQRPNYVTTNSGLSTVPSYTKKGTQYLNPNGFAAATSGNFGNVPSYGLVLPNFQNWDVSLAKSFRLTERISTDLRGEFFNVANHLSYTSVVTVLGTSNFGQVNGASDPRTLEFAVRFKF